MISLPITLIVCGVSSSDWLNLGDCTASILYGLRCPLTWMVGSCVGAPAAAEADVGDGPAANDGRLSAMPVIRVESARGRGLPCLDACLRCLMPGMKVLALFLCVAMAIAPIGAPRRLVSGDSMFRSTQRGARGIA